MTLFQQGMFQINPRDTPETIARKRALANQIMNGPAVAPRSTADGIGNMFGSIMGGIAARNMNNKADAAEAAGQESAASAFNPLLDAFRSRTGLDAGGFPAAPNPGDSTSMAAMPAPDYASARVAQAHGDSTAPAGNLTESKQAFINALMPAAMQVSQRTGIDPRIIVAQAAQETGWGRSAPGNNYFGIKSHGQGGGQTFATHEYVNGKRVNTRDSFRRFDSPADSVRGYGDFILKNPRYRPFMAAQGLDAQLEALQASNYATDPNYSRSVGAIARGIPLDSPVAANAAMATGGLSNGLTPDALQQWAFANYAQQPQGDAVDAVNGLATGTLPDPAQWPDVQRRAMASAPADPATWPQRQAELMRETSPQWLNDMIDGNGVPVAETEADILAQEQAMMAQDPQAFQQPGKQPRLQASAAPQAAPPLPPAQFVQDRPIQGIQTAQDRGFPEMAGRNPQALPAPGIDMQMIANVLTNPFSNPEQRAFAQMLLEQQMQARDPMRQLQLEKGRLEVEAMRNPQPKDTDDIREYNYARQQGYQGSFTDFMTDMRRAGATSVNVGAGEKAWDQESAKLFAKRYDDISAGAMNAQQMMGMYDLAEQALNSGVRTGLGAEAELTLRQMGAAMGMDTDPEKLAGGELVRAVQNRMALTMRSPDGGMGMPGALSDRDIKFLKDSQIGIDRSPEGNRRMLEAFRAMENRKIEIARLADDYIAQNGRLDSGFNQMVREYASSNPLFPEGPKKITTQDEFNALPSGAEFVAPDGSIRRKP